MRLLKYNESYKKNYSDIKDIVRSIWKIDEDEIFEAFTDLHDEIDYVDIEISLFLKSANNEYLLDYEYSNLEKIESLAEAGFKPCININFSPENSNHVVSREKMYTIQAYAMEAIYNIDDYSIFKTRSSYGHFIISLEYNENSYEVKSKYHKKPLSSFEPILKYFKDNLYDVSFSRLFVSDKSGSLTYVLGSRKIYQIVLTKEVRVGKLDVIDEMAEAKSKILTMADQIPDIDDVAYLFDIGTPSLKMKGLISIKFIIDLYEK